MTTPAGRTGTGESLRPRPHDGREPHVFAWTAAALGAAYLALRFVAPHLAVWLGLTSQPAPIPRFATGIYMLCAVVGALAYVSSDERRWRLFLGPVVRLFVLAPGRGWRTRVAILAVIPILAGWCTWQRVVPGPAIDPVIRLQHPTLPVRYAAAANPLPPPDEESRRAGVVLYQTNCRPCHGAVADGNGPLARGLRLRPVDFTDGGAIASLVESYPFWRIREGHPALPGIATPWNSAMPAWSEHLTDDDIWRIVVTEYELSGTEPRRPEGAER